MDDKKASRLAEKTFDLVDTFRNSHKSSSKKRHHEDDKRDDKDSSKKTKIIDDNNKSVNNSSPGQLTAMQVNKYVFISYNQRQIKRWSPSPQGPSRYLIFPLVHYYIKL